MRTPYKLEIFSRDFVFRSFSAMPRQTIDIDYLALAPITLDLPAITAQQGDYAVISEGAEQIFCGIVDSTTSDGKAMRLTIKPMQALFDAEILPPNASFETAEAQICGILRSYFAESDDALQNIPGLEIQPISATPQLIGMDDGTVRVIDIITTALSAHGIVVDMQLLPQEQTLLARVGTRPESVTIEADLPAIVNREIVLGDDYGSLNKLYVADENDATRSAIYYLHTDGTVSAENTDRITPVFFSTALVRGSDAEDFAAQAFEQANNALLPQRYDNLIELTAPSDSRVFPAALPIGARAAIISGGRTLNSILTGINRAPETTTLVFGVVRIDLTKKLTLQRRA